ncbi:Mobile element protein [Minicystis rosea]|nr:Mobile element protein [Minicystis rosea]
MWWIKLGIVPERIEPGKPQQNGRHERMHRTLKDDKRSSCRSTGGVTSTTTSGRTRLSRSRRRRRNTRRHDG